MVIDAPPNFLIDSNASPKVKTMELKELGYTLSFVALWGYKGMLEYWDGE
jgi:hypothetical protein